MRSFTNRLFPDLGHDRGGRGHDDVRDEEAAMPEDDREEGQQAQRNQWGQYLQKFWTADVWNVIGQKKFSSAKTLGFITVVTENFL